MFSILPRFFHVSYAKIAKPRTKGLVHQYFQADFDLLCQRFGYCDRGTKSTCLVQVPGMCPPKEFDWDANLKQHLILQERCEHLIIFDIF